MNLHYFQHVTFEGPGSIERWALKNNHRVTSTKWYLNQKPPQLSSIDWLIVMGGPMSIYDTRDYPWLGSEKEYIHQAIAAGKIVVGICLGAQLIADILGGNITTNNYCEIGWFPVIRSEQLRTSGLIHIIPAEFEVFHWHGETFNLPPECKLIASSQACQNQGFIYKDRVIGLQFHTEMTIESAAELIHNCQDQIREEKYIQTEHEMLSIPEKFINANRILDAILDYLNGL